MQYHGIDRETDTYWLGTFTASDGKQVVYNATYDEPPVPLRKGQKVAGQLLGNSEVVAPRGSSQWLLPAGMILVGGYPFWLWLWLFPIANWRKRRRRYHKLLAMQADA